MQLTRYLKIKLNITSSMFRDNSVSKSCSVTTHTFIIIIIIIIITITAMYREYFIDWTCDYELVYYPFDTQVGTPPLLP